MKVLLLALVSLAAPLVGADSPAKFGTLGAGMVAPDFKATGFDGKEVKLSDFRGKIVVLNFWSTNRGPAEALQGPFLNYRDDGVVVIGVCCGAAREEFDQAVAKRKDAVGYLLAWDPAGRDRAASVSQKNFGIGVYPATGVIDREGKIVGGFVGFGAQSTPLLRGYLRDAGVPIPPDPELSTNAPRPPSPPPESNLPKSGTVAPDFTALDSAGGSVTLSQFAGKVVVLDFWATWCGPCIQSMPHTQRVAAATKTQDVVVLAVCTSDTRGNFDSWLKENQAKYPDIAFACDPFGRDSPPEKFAERASVKLYKVSGIPTQFVIGRDGKIAGAMVGYGGEADNRLEEALQQLGVNKLPAK